MPRAFRGLKTAPKPSYDAVVIGAGIGGLVCANLLARAGLEVLLVEQHYMAGGYCSTFRRAGFTFDAATHFYPLLGNPSTLTGQLLAELGVRTTWIKMDPVDHFHFPDGSEFKVPADFGEYIRRLKVMFPQERTAIDSFFALAQEAYFAGLLFYFRRRETQRFCLYRDLTVREVLDRHFQDGKLKLLLTADCSHWGSPPSRTSFVFDSMLRLAYFLGNYYPVGGSQAFADELAARFEQQGGDILMSALVTRILVNNRRVSGVELERGNGRSRAAVRVAARSVVSNGDMIHTIRRLLGAEWADPDYLESVQRLRPSLPCFLFHAGVMGVSTDALRRADGYHWSCWDAERVATCSTKIFVPTLYEPRMAPRGGHVIVVQKLTAPRYGSVRDWTEYKAAAEQPVVRLLNQVIPGFSEKTIHQSSASARTSHRFTLNYQGAMLGWEMSPWQLGPMRPDIHGPVPGLYFTGHWTQPGGGVTPVIISAMRVAREIAGAGEAACAPAPVWTAGAAAGAAAMGAD